MLPEKLKREMMDLFGEISIEEFSANPNVISLTESILNDLIEPDLQKRQNVEGQISELRELDLKLEMLYHQLSKEERSREKISNGFSSVRSKINVSLTSLIRRGDAHEIY